MRRFARHSLAFSIAIRAAWLGWLPFAPQFTFAVGSKTAIAPRVWPGDSDPCKLAHGGRLIPKSEVHQLQPSASWSVSMAGQGRFQPRRSWIRPHHPSPNICHSDRRDGVFCRPGAEVRFSIARFLCDESLSNFRFQHRFSLSQAVCSFDLANYLCDKLC